MNAEYERALGQNIWALRMKKGFSQEQLAAQLQVRGCDVTRSALAKIEVGQRHIYPDELRALRDILGVAFEELLPALP
ncbi:MAG TPA: helix-turn-helix domain-containing protein [Candidatus Fournierella pullicola]|uniref:Helix-turn-helix domain-containing protein n=1 Tax=Candidatus Allofournierella pullicola TaxID=2838596 RepID=A0A9D1V2B4_9FIRM|nr:helix-turn-helix domain-containing protein [Candidatus Fournierella pullicola]